MSINNTDKLSGLKLTYIGQAMADGTGMGGGARLNNMINIFKSIGIKIELISFSFYSDKSKIDHIKVDDYLQITQIHMHKSLPRFMKALAILPVFIYSAKSSRTSDIIFSDFITEIAYIPAIVNGIVFKKPTILDLIDAKFFKIVPNIVNRTAANHANLIFAISHYLEVFCKTEYACTNVIYMPMYIDCDIFKIDVISRKDIRQKFGIKDDEIVIGYAGTFAHWEGLTVLLQAFSNLAKKYPKIKLAIMGNMYTRGDDDINYIINKMGIKSKVILISSQAHEAVPKYLSAFDILCCPKTDCEINRAANPVKVVEYLSMGLPSVCSAVGGIKDTIKDNISGFLVKPGDTDDLESKLEWVILNPEKAQKIGYAGREEVEKYYSYNVFKAAMVHAISNLLDGSS